MIKEIIEKVKNKFENGVYIEVEVDEKTKTNLLKYCEDNNISSNDDYHCTLIYSKKPFKGKIEKKDVTHIKGKIKEFVRFDNPEEDIYALALKLDCKQLEDLHNFYMKKYDFRYDYDSYIAHITLSYKAKNIDYKKLPIPDFEVGFSKMNIEGLNENWADDKN